MHSALALVRKFVDPVTISVLSLFFTRSFALDMFIPRAHLVKIERIFCERWAWICSSASLGRVPWRSSMCASMKSFSSQFAKNCGAASHLSKLSSSRRSAMMSTQRVPARLRPYSRFRSRRSTEVEFSNAACCSIHSAGGST